MFDQAKLEKTLTAALPKGAELALEATEVDGTAAANATLTSGTRATKRVWTEADMKSPKFAAQVKHFCASHGAA